jgi:hypothetical protein
LQEIKRHQKRDNRILLNLERDLKVDLEALERKFQQDLSVSTDLADSSKCNIWGALKAFKPARNNNTNSAETVLECMVCTSVYGQVKSAANNNTIEKSNTIHRSPGNIFRFPVQDRCERK